MTSAIVRWRWRLVRRRRFRRALAALRAGRPDDVRRALAHPGAADNERAERLSAIGAVMAAPTVPNAERCVAAVEGAGDLAEPEELSMATAALELALRLGPSDDPARIAHVARLTARLTQVTGPLPWGHYNLAVHAITAGEFDAAARHLAAGATAPARGWPAPLLGAACATILGRPAELSRWLTGLTVHPGFAGDHWFFSCVGELFGSLRDDGPVDATRLGGCFGGPSGPLTRAVPQLAALKALLRDAVLGVPARTELVELGGCAWGGWLRDRLRYAGGEAVDVLEAAGPAGPAGADPIGDEEPALVWQRLGSRQDLLPLLPESIAQMLRQQLVDFGRHLTSGTVWLRLIEQRVQLAAESSAAADAAAPGPEPSQEPRQEPDPEHGPEPDPEPGPCPWWPADGVLQTSARGECEVERRYLEGRRSLRRGLVADARQRFAAARARLTRQGMATWLVALRFGPLLAYWEGVALAHLGRVREAAGTLRTCAEGIKAREARAQLGLLALATGDHAVAAKLLDTIAAPRPAAADYLAAVLHARSDGAASAAERLLDGFERRPATTGVYGAAAHRLLGRMWEAEGELAVAGERYRLALSRRPADIVAAARLARVWLCRRYDAEIPPEPLLDRHWPKLAGVQWAAALPLLHDCLDLDLDPAAAPPERLLERVPAHPALRLVVLRTVIAAGAAERAADVARLWAAAGEPEPKLVRAVYAAQASRLTRDFCGASGDGPVRSELAELERRLRLMTADPVLAFWAAVARLMLNPGSIATAPPLAAMDDESRSAPVRLFAGLMSCFAEEPERRRAGARRCLAVLDAAAPAPPAGPAAPVRAAVRCLATNALGDDREFLTAYEEIEMLDRALPCDPAAGYLAATEARLRVGDLDSVIDGFIPKPLADLADPGVRHAMAIAYSRRAARTANQDPRKSLRDLEQARDLLRDLSAGETDDRVTPAAEREQS